MKEKKELTREKITAQLNKSGASVHFIGIGGVSMYSLANLLLERGVRVTGSDTQPTERTRRLSERGALISHSHTADNVRSATLVVYSHAISESNPERLAALALGIPTLSRAEFMGTLMLDFGTRIGVSGSHGKSTTVGMLDAIFTLAERHPGVLCGANLDTGEPYRIGEKNCLIYEGCEYRDSFLHFSPTVFVALNLELDHTDYFPDLSSLCTSFEGAMESASDLILISSDDEELMRLGERSKKRVITFGGGERAFYRYRICEICDGRYGFEVYRAGVLLGKFSLNLVGAFNIASATAAIAVATELGIDTETVKRAISDFRGLEGRMEHAGRRYGREVYFDYAHHPTEIRATVNALKMHTRSPLTVIFKPHTYSRTKSLWNDFRSALSSADYLIVTDVYPAREREIAGVSSRKLVGGLGSRAYFAAECEVLSLLDSHTEGAIVVMGAGGLEEIKRDILT